MLNTKKWLLQAVAFALIASVAVTSCATKKELKPKFKANPYALTEFKSSPQVMISGVVNAYGTDVFHYVGLVTDNQNYLKLVGPLEERLFNECQTKAVTLLARQGEFDEIDLVQRFYVDEVIETSN